MKWNKVLLEKRYVQRTVDTYDGRRFMILLGGKMEIQVKNNKFRFITKLTDGPSMILKIGIQQNLNPNHLNNYQMI